MGEKQSTWAQIALLCCEWQAPANFKGMRYSRIADGKQLWDFAPLQ
jgi:hypothetical protein